MRMIPENYAFPEVPLVPISVAAQLLGISINMLRLYEAEGLILPARTASNQRRYSRDDLTRVLCIRHAIQHEHMTLESIKRLMAMLPCWEIMQCTTDEREGCEAFRGSRVPCWTLTHNKNVCVAEECRACKVYKMASNCDTIKQAIVTSTSRT